MIEVKKDQIIHAKFASTVISERFPFFVDHPGEKQGNGLDAHSLEISTSWRRLSHSSFLISGFGAWTIEG
jgi:hypothetical protein